MWAKALAILFASGTVALADTYGQRVLAAVLLSEARGEGEKGMTAVAEVIRNRADLLGVTPLAVVTKRGEFACLRRRTPDQLIERFEKNKAWPVALKIARVTYNEPEKLPGIVKGAKYYHSGNPSWAKAEKPIVIVGRLKFYDLPL